jgi:hypothetical protein
MSTLQTSCAIEPAAAKSMALAKPVATLILGTLLLLIRP